MKWIQSILNIFFKSKPKLKSRDERKNQAIKLINTLKDQYNKESNNSDNVLIKSECSKNYLQLSLIEVQLIMNIIEPTSDLIASIEKAIITKF